MLNPYTSTIEKIEENYTGRHNRKDKGTIFFRKFGFLVLNYFTKIQAFNLLLTSVFIFFEATYTILNNNILRFYITHFR